MEGICAVCSTHKRVHKNRKTGKLICTACYQRDPSRHEQCSVCEEVKSADEEDKKLISAILTDGFTEEHIRRFMEMMKRLNVFMDCFELLNERFNREKKKLWLPDSDLRTLVSSSVIIVRLNKLLSAAKKYAS